MLVNVSVELLSHHQGVILCRHKQHAGACITIVQYLVTNKRVYTKHLHGKCTMLNIHPTCVRLRMNTMLLDGGLVIYIFCLLFLVYNIYMDV